MPIKFLATNYNLCIVDVRLTVTEIQAQAFGSVISTPLIPTIQIFFFFTRNDDDFAIRQFFVWIIITYANTLHVK